MVCFIQPAPHSFLPFKFNLYTSMIRTCFTLFSYFFFLISFLAPIRSDHIEFLPLMVSASSGSNSWFYCRTSWVVGAAVGLSDISCFTATKTHPNIMHFAVLLLSNSSCLETCLATETHALCIRGWETEQ